MKEIITLKKFNNPQLKDYNLELIEKLTTLKPEPKPIKSNNLYCDNDEDNFYNSYLLNKTYSLLSGIGLSFILGGALGNLVDRIIHGKVTDFIDWYYHNHHWPAFNIADSFISVGVALLIIEGLFFAEK